MTFPTIAATNTSMQDASGVTSHTVNLPAGISSGDLLIVFFNVDGGPTVTWPAGWTELFSTASPGTSLHQCRYRRADGTEGASITITTDVSEMSSHAAYRITGHHATTDPEAGTSATSSSAEPDPPSLSASWGSEDNLWIALAGWDQANRDVSTYPTNYSLSQLTDAASNTQNAGYAIAARELAAASEDPGVFTLASGASWVANTIAVRPAAAGGGGGSPPVAVATSSGGPLPLALQLYEERGGALIADLSDATSCVIDNGRHGFRSLSCFVPMPLELAFAIAEQCKAKWLSLNYGAGVVWEGRVEDPTVVIAEDGTGLALTAFGSWRSLFDVPYTALWSKSGTAGWKQVTGDESSLRLPERFEMDNNNRLYIALKKGTAYTTSHRASWIYKPPHGNSRKLVSVSFDYEFLASSDYEARLVSVNEGWTGALEWTLTGTGSLQTGSRRIGFSPSRDWAVFDLFVLAGGTYSGETGDAYLKITNIRVVTSVENEVNTTLSANTSTGTQTVSVGSTANMYVGQSLFIAQGNANRERVIVEAVDSATSFTATFAFTHSAGHAVAGDVIYADEIIKDLVAHVTSVNPAQLSPSTALIESPGLDLLDESYEDAWPGDIATKLAGLGDNQSPPRLWEVGVWEGQRLHFRPKGSDGQVWAVDADELTVNSTLELLRNSMYASYQDANNRTLRTAVADDTASQAQYGITRRGVVSASTTSATQAETHRDAALEDGRTIRPRSELQPDYLMDQTGAIAPKWLARAGQTMNIRNLPPTLGSEVDRIRTFLLEENSYDLMEDELTPVPEEPVASLEVLVARRGEGF